MVDLKWCLLQFSEDGIDDSQSQGSHDRQPSVGLMQRRLYGNGKGWRLIRRHAWGQLIDMCLLSFTMVVLFSKTWLIGHITEQELLASPATHPDIPKLEVWMKPNSNGYYQCILLKTLLSKKQLYRRNQRLKTFVFHWKITRSC